MVDRRDLLQAEPLVVVGADPLGGVELLALQGRVDLGTRDRLRLHAELGEHLPAHAADPELQPLQVGEALDLAAEPAAHLGAGVAARQADQPGLGEDLGEQFGGAARLPPRGGAPGIEAEGHRGRQREGRILGHAEGRRPVAHLDGAGGHGVEQALGRDRLAGPLNLDLEAPVGGLRDDPAERLGRAVQDVEGLGVGGGQPPAQLRGGFGPGRRGERTGERRGRAEAGGQHAAAPRPGRGGSREVRFVQRHLVRAGPARPGRIGVAGSTCVPVLESRGRPGQFRRASKPARARARRPGCAPSPPSPCTPSAAWRSWPATARAA